MRVALKVSEGTYQVGTVKEIKDDKTLVNFERRGYSRWVNSSKLKEVN